MIITYFRSTRYTFLNTYNPCSIREQVSLTSGPISPLTFLLFRHFSTCPYLCWDSEHKQPMTYTKIIWMGNELVSLLGICVIRWRAAGTSKDTIQSFVVLWWTFINFSKEKLKFMKIFLGIAGIFLLSLKEVESFQKSGRQNNLLFALCRFLQIGF